MAPGRICGSCPYWRERRSPWMVPVCMSRRPPMSTGRHVFSNLPPGEYTVGGALEGYTIPSPLAGAGELQRLCRGGIAATARSRGERPYFGQGWPSRRRRDCRSRTEAAKIRKRASLCGRFLHHGRERPIELRRLTAGDYYLGISLSRSPTLQNPYTRWFYPGSEDPAAAAMVHVSDKPEVLAVRPDGAGPAARSCDIGGTVFWPDGRFAEGVNIFLEDPRWPWLTSNVAATTDKQGRFTVHALDGTRYRLHAAAFVNAPVSAEPALIDPGGCAARPETRPHPERVFAPRWFHQQSIGRLAQGPRPALSHMMIT